jgi:hypothetical protein
LSYGTVGPAPKIMSRELKGLEQPFAYIKKQVLPYSKENAYQRELAMIQTAFNSVAGFDHGSYTSKNYKDVLKNENQAGPCNGAQRSLGQA